jgi:surfeit locus 1 family protein
MPVTFRFRLIPFIACAIAATLGMLLGEWQTRRAHEKEAIEAKLTERAAAPPLVLNSGIPDIDSAEYRRATARGEFMRDWPVYLDNRPHDGAAGFYVLMPFHLAGTNMHVLVARGWVRRDPLDRAKLPALATPQGTVEIAGVVKRNPGHILQLGEAGAVKPGAILQNLEPRAFAAASGLVTAPFVLEQNSDAGDGLVRDWPRASTGVDKHRGYAFQWYALAVTALLFFVATGFRRGTKQA